MLGNGWGEVDGNGGRGHSAPGQNALFCYFLSSPLPYRRRRCRARCWVQTCKQHAASPHVQHTATHGYSPRAQSRMRSIFARCIESCARRAAAKASSLHADSPRLWLRLPLDCVFRVAAYAARTSCCRYRRWRAASAGMAVASRWLVVAGSHGGAAVVATAGELGAGVCVGAESSCARHSRMSGIELAERLSHGHWTAASSMAGEKGGLVGGRGSDGWGDGGR